MPTTKKVTLKTPAGAVHKDATATPRADHKLVSRKPELLGTRP